MSNADSSRRQPRLRSAAIWAAAATALLTSGITGSLALLGAPVVAHAATTTYGTYVPLAPARIADTRTGSGLPNAGQTLGAGATDNIQVTGVGGVPTGGVAAVIINLAATNTTAPSFFTVFPEGTTQPLVASLNFGPATTVSNLVTVPVGTQGGISIFNNAGSADAVVDVEGYYTNSVQGSGLYDAVAPYRALGSSTAGVSAAAGSVTPVTVVGGSTGIPTTASAVVGNLTVAGGTAATYLTAYPAGQAKPTAAALNAAAGQTIGNRVTVPVGAAGVVDLYNNAGTVSEFFDLVGYYTGVAGAAGSAFVPITPVRVSDTRIANNGSAIGAGKSETFAFAAAGIPATATGVATNVTVVPGASSGYLTVYPTSEATAPVTADINWSANVIAQNFTIAPVAGDVTDIYNNPGGPVNVVIDAFGYFAPFTPGISLTPATTTMLVTNGTTHTQMLTVLINGANGTVPASDPVNFTFSPAGCGSVTGNPVTITAGTGMVTFTSGHTPGACTITAQESAGGNTTSTVVTELGYDVLTNLVPNTTSDVSTAPGSQETLSLTVDSSSGAVIPGDTVTFTASGTCGTLAAPSETTTAGGVATDTYTSSATVGFCTVTATDPTFPGTVPVTYIIDQTANPAITAPTITMSASPTSLLANGTSTSTLTGSVLQSTTGTPPLANDPISLVVTPFGPGIVCGTVSPTTTTTSATGAFTAMYTSSTSTTAGSCVVTATEADYGKNTGGTVQIAQTVIDIVTLTLSPSTLPADGTSKSTVTALVTTPTGTPVSGDVVNFTGGGPACGGASLSPASMTTSATGVATSVFQAGTTAEYCTITATESNTSGTMSAVLQLQGASAAPTVTLSTTANTTDPAGTNVPFTVTVMQGTIAVAGVGVEITGTGTGCTGSNLPVTNVTTNTSGVYSGTYMPAATQLGTCTLTATEAAHSSSSTGLVITQIGVNTVAVSPASQLESGAGTTDTITATVSHSAGATIPAGTTVTFSTVGTGCGTFTPSTPIASTAMGNFSVNVTYTVGATQGFCKIVATESQYGDSGSVYVTQTANPSQGADTAIITPTAIPGGTSLPANGTSTYTLGGSVFQSGGVNPEVGDQVMIKLTGTGCGTLASSVVTTSATGAFSDVYTAGTGLGTCSFTDSEAATGSSSSGGSLTQDSVVTASTTSLTASFSGTKTATAMITVSTGAGPIAGETFAYTDTGPAFCGTGMATTTNASGVSTFTYTATGAGTGFCYFTVTDNEVDGGSVTFTVDQTS